MAQSEHRQHQRPLKHRHRLRDAVSVLLEHQNWRQKQKHNHWNENDISSIPSEIGKRILDRDSQLRHKQTVSVRLSEMQHRIQLSECEERQNCQTDIRHCIVDENGTDKDSHHYPPRLRSVDDLRDIQFRLNLSHCKQDRTHHRQGSEYDGNHQNDLGTLLWKQIT